MSGILNQKGIIEEIENSYNNISEEEMLIPYQL